MSDAVRSGDQWQLSGGKQLPGHLAKLRIPPAWSKVRVSSDPGADVLVTGFDAKGRKQTVYSDSWSMRQAAAKFDKIVELQHKASAIESQINEGIASGNENALVAKLIFISGVRPGSDRDTKSEKKAYGATTLLARHVVTDGDSVRLEFTGKKGVALSIPITDANLAKKLREKSTSGDADARLFPGVNDTTLRDYIHSLDGGSFRPKDFRTRLGSAIAAAEVRKIRVHGPLLVELDRQGQIAHWLAPAPATRA